MSQHTPLYISSPDFFPLYLYILFPIYPFPPAPGGRFIVLHHYKPPTGIKNWLPWLTEVMQVDLCTYKKTGLFDALHILYMGSSISKCKILGKIAILSDLKKLILMIALTIMCTL